MANTVTGEITSIDRLPSSTNGNPRYSLTIGARQFVTSSDISDAYEIGNIGYRVGNIVRLTLTRSGRISFIDSIDPQN